MDKIKKPTINEMLISAIAYRNPNNSLIENIGTMVEVWTALRKRKKEVIKELNRKL